MCSTNSRDNHLWLGLVAFVVGAVMLLEQFDLVPSETWTYLIPAILILSGIKLMVSSCGSNMCECGSCEMIAVDEPVAMSMPAPKKSSAKKSSRKK